MMQLEWRMLEGILPAKISADLRTRVDLGTARAADVVVGFLRRFSLSEVLHGRTGKSRS